MITDFDILDSVPELLPVTERGNAQFRLNGGFVERGKLLARYAQLPKLGFVFSEVHMIKKSSYVELGPGFHICKE
jgi:hypothetical protein